MSNSSSLHQDGLQDVLVCGATQDHRFNGLCNFVAIGLGCCTFIGACTGFWAARWQFRIGDDKLLKAEQAQTIIVTASSVISNQSLSRMNSLTQGVNRFKKRVAPGSRVFNTLLTLLIASRHLLCSIWLLLGVGGTRYPSHDIRGFTSDCCFGVSVAVESVVCLLQLKGAKWFASLFGARVDHVKQNQLTCNQQVIQSGYLDISLSFISFISIVASCALLGQDSITRSQFYTIIFVMYSMWHFRSLYTMITKRAKGIVRVIDITNAEALYQSPQARKRRLSAIGRKTRELILDVMATTWGALGYLTVVIFGSVYSSEQMLIHVAVLWTVSTLIMVLTSFALRDDLALRWKQLRKRSSKNLKKLRDKVYGGFQPLPKHTEGSIVRSDS